MSTGHGFRSRPIRALIYLPVVRLGVNDSDWKFVIGFAVFAATVPFALDLNVAGVPVALPGAVFGLAGSIGFFNLCRRNRRPRWLEHKLASLVTPSVRRRRQPSDRSCRPVRPWLISGPDA